MILRGDGSFSFVAEIIGNDLQVHNVNATWFGGPDDREDSGETASGVSTRDHPTLLGCALPMDGFHNPHTDGSPIPRLPWNTFVRVKNLRSAGQELSLPLIDLGPSKYAASHAAIDLTEAAFKALGGRPADGIMMVDFTIPGAANLLGSSTNSRSLVAPHVPAADAARLDHDHGPEVDVAKPPLKAFIRSPNFSARSPTVPVDMIVLHFTDGPSASSAINRFVDPASQVSAHYIIDRNGDIYQMVHDADKAWHAKASNGRSIGIEHVALPGQGMAGAQQDSSVALLRWLMTSYNIKRAGLTGHRFAPGNAGTTDCPDGLFGEATEQAVRDWVAVHFADLP